MLNKKRVFVSLGASIFIFVVGLFAILLTWRILNSPEWISTGIIWILVWPTRLLVYVICIPYPGGLGAVILALSIGIATDVAILSGLIYAALTLFRRNSSRPAPPPPPLLFQRSNTSWSAYRNYAHRL